ncbi:MAG: type II toxin-antitoxin system RelE/ParE family toxin [Desulfobulbaceae bacterium]|nr:type II toxin-antitoxin system RelE/ParE family toxin [Desulfobulbaceae bacterium]
MLLLRSKKLGTLSLFFNRLYSDYRIIYRIDGKSIFILTVRHGRQILPNDEILT